MLSGLPLETMPCETPSSQTSTPSMLDSNTRVPNLGAGGVAGLALDGIYASSILGSKLVLSEVGFCCSRVYSRTWVCTYSASSSAVTTPSPSVSAAPSIPETT